MSLISFAAIVGGGFGAVMFVLALIGGRLMGIPFS